MDTLKAEKRNKDEKAKRLRREGYVTGNLFGKKIEGSIPVKMPKQDVEKLMKTHNKGSQIMLDVDGTAYDVLIKEVDFNPMSYQYDEVDFQALVNGEMVHSVAEVVLVGHEKITEGVLQENIREIAYKALPAAIVDKVKIDVSKMKLGDSIKVRDLDIARDKDVVLSTDLDTVVVSLNVVHVKAEDLPDDTAAAVEAAPAAAPDKEEK